MKKWTLIYLIFVFLLLISFFARKSPFHSVVKINSATEIYVDFNNNHVADVNELILLDDEFDSPDFLTLSEQLKLNFLAKEYAKKNLLNKKVKVHNEDNRNSLIKIDGSSYQAALRNNGYVYDGTNKEKVLSAIAKANNYDLVAYNKFTHKYHLPDCSFLTESSAMVVMDKSELPKEASPCQVCMDIPRPQQALVSSDINTDLGLIYKDDILEFYVTDFTKYFYPSNKCVTDVCKSLLKEINSAKKSIDFAIYGIDGQPEITNALISAKNRGVSVRWVFDTDKHGKTIYKESLSLSEKIVNNRKDIDYNDSVKDIDRRDAIMHNKFFIFDKQKVWTGSANISHTDLSGFNANSVVLINSKDIAQLYSDEFDRMYDGFFHLAKAKTMKSSVTYDGSIIYAGFSPQDKLIVNKLLPLIERASKYIYVPVFVLTHKHFQEALINASKRNVDVRLIVDATSAASRYSSVKYLRDNGIKVKVENRAGKMHMKSMIIDDLYTVVGSMNFTKSGEDYNDENIIIIKNPKLTKVFKSKFLYFWTSISDNWLYKNPPAESFASLNSCSDGIDNDFDGKIDGFDEGCFLHK